MKTLSENRCFGGTQGVYTHASDATGTDMTFGLFQPKHGSGAVLWYLSGLTCTQDNVTTKAGFQRMVDYWKRQPTDENWKALFEEVFEISVEEFYDEGKRASLKDLSLSAMGDLRRIRF